MSITDDLATLRLIGLTHEEQAALDRVESALADTRRALERIADSQSEGDALIARRALAAGEGTRATEEQT